MTVFTILGLIFNIRTNVIHNESKSIMTMLAQIKEENRLLEYQVLQKTRLDNIELIARDQLKMVQPKRVIYFDPKDTPTPHVQ